MGKIIAIGRGEIGRPGYPIETTAIDKEIIRLSGKIKPKLLFIPTASDDSEGYIQAVKKHFGQRLGCKVSSLLIFRQKLSEEEIKKQVLSSDIIYVGGGNTLSMMKRWRKVGLDKILLEAYQKKIILSGLSAGAICWFKSGCSDSRRFSNPGADLIRVRGLNLVNALFSPHFDVELHRQKDLKKMMKNKPGVALAFDNCAAIEIVNDQYRIITSKKTAKAYKIFWQGQNYYQEIIPTSKTFQPLTNLTNKKIKI